jgi:hypothetical protein
MSLVPSFVQLLQPFFQQMTAPTSASLLTLLAGWIFARRHHVTGALLAAGMAPPKHHSAYHRVLASACWDLDAVGLALLDLILHLAVASDATVQLVIDDTLCRKCGHKIFGAGMHYDPLLTGPKLSNTGKSLKSRGHCWVILGVVVVLPFRPGFYFCLPVLFRLCLNKRSARKHHQPYRSRPELGRELLQQVATHRPERHFHLLVDSAYGGQDTLAMLPANCDLTARWILNARLCRPAEPKAPGKKGPQRRRGAALPSPRQMLQQRCRHLELDVYGEHRRFRVNDALACLYTVPGRLLRIVVSEPLSRSGHPRPKQQACFYSTVLESDAKQVLEGFAPRWSIEVTIHDAKQQLGLEQPQSHSEQAVRRTAPMLLLLYSLVVLWFAQQGHRHWRKPRRPWYRQKQHASFADMLATLRAGMLRQHLQVTWRPRSATGALKKTLKTTLQIIRLAA